MEANARPFLKEMATIVIVKKVSDLDFQIVNIKKVNKFFEWEYQKKLIQNIASLKEKSCPSNSCLNGGTCDFYKNTVNNNITRSYCKCADGFKGEKCEEKRQS